VKVHIFPSALTRENYLSGHLFQVGRELYLKHIALMP